MKNIPIIFSLLIIFGAGCTNSVSITPPSEESVPKAPVAIEQPTTSKQIEETPIINPEPTAEDLMKILPPDDWRQVSQWKKLENGNYWMLTTQIVSQDTPKVTNPCFQKNNCPVESWIINPTKKFLI